MVTIGLLDISEEVGIPSRAKIDHKVFSKYYLVSLVPLKNYVAQNLFLMLLYY